MLKSMIGLNKVNYTLLRVLENYRGILKPNHKVSSYTRTPRTMQNPRWAERCVCADMMLWSQSLLLCHEIFPSLKTPDVRREHLVGANVAIQSLGGKVWPAQNDCEATGVTAEQKKSASNLQPVLETVAHPEVQVLT